MSGQMITVPTPGQPAVILLDSPAHLACKWCGVQVPPPEAGLRAESFLAVGRQNPAIARIDDLTRGVRTQLSVCDTCAEVKTAAVEILTRFPEVRMSIGHPDVAVYRVEAALHGIEALGIDMKVESSAIVWQLIEHMTIPGALLAWSRRFAPILVRDASEASCTSRRWAHVSEDQRNELRRAGAALLRARTERPRPYAPPVDSAFRGCLLCGVGAVVALPSRSHEVWTRERISSPRALGADPGTQPIEGYCCRTCSAAIEESGAVGPTAVERALRLHLGAPRRPYSDAELRGRAAWAVVAPDFPNVRPWQHISNLDEVARELGRV